MRLKTNGPALSLWREYFQKWEFGKIMFKHGVMYLRLYIPGDTTFFYLCGLLGFRILDFESSRLCYSVYRPDLSKSPIYTHTNKNQSKQSINLLLYLLSLPLPSPLYHPKPQSTTTTIATPSPSQNKQPRTKLPLAANIPTTSIEQF